MKIVFAMSQAVMFRHFDRVIRNLLADGHEVTLLRQPRVKPGVTERAIEQCEADEPRFKAGWLFARADRWRKITRLRDIASYSAYLRTGHPSRSLKARLEPRLPVVLLRALRWRAVERLFETAAARAVFQVIERIVPADQAIKRWLLREQADVVVASPFIYAGSWETDYVKAARAAGIPTMVAVASWDNLTTKGTFHVQPDVTMAWNEALKREATALHDLPPETILVTGAPTFDDWFDLRPSTEREEFCRLVGLDPALPYVVYLCSSRFITGDETAFVREFARAVQDIPGVGRVQVLARPHPLNAAIWQDVRAEGFAVWPREGDWPDAQSAKVGYFDTLWHAAAAVGVNTSGFIDAAAVDRPCITIVTDRHRSTQSEIGHFQHLVDGKFLEWAEDMAAAREAVRRIVGGEDRNRANRRAFVKQFIRPWGMDHAASRIMALAIQTVARRGAMPAEALQGLVASQLDEPGAARREAIALGGPHGSAKVPSVAGAAAAR